MSGQKKETKLVHCPILNKRVAVTFIWGEIYDRRITDIMVSTCDSVLLCNVAVEIGTAYKLDWTKCPIAQSLPQRQ